MIISWNWLKEYVDLGMSLDELTERLTLSGLNLEGVEKVGDDVAIDLEVTSNRPDCLGHLGVAREVAVLWDGALREPGAKTQAEGVGVDSLTSVGIESPELCTRYTARVIRGVRVGPSPDWLANRLQTLGIAVINNVVDITNYVMMECGQPLHAFDFSKIAGSKIIVRASTKGEKFMALDHREYGLDAGMCVIGDAEKPIALGGVMGGAATEVGDATTDLLIEAADFDPISVRTTARRLHLHSPSSYRFERGVDPERVDWASRRCCALILDLAGGELASGVLDVGAPRAPREPVKLRFRQLERILGITIPEEKVRHILTSLGNVETHACQKCVKVVPPSWRADLTREIDLVEEVARIHGYDQIPEDVGVAMVASTRSRDDLVLDKIRSLLVAAGFDEAMNISAVEEDMIGLFRPWTTAEPLQTSTPVLRRADRLRQSLVPSLLAARRSNETLSNLVIELFEIAKIYIPQPGELPQERRMLGLTSGKDFLVVKGVIEAILHRVAPSEKLEILATEHSLFDGDRSCELRLGGNVFGYLGEVGPTGLEAFDLRNPTTVAELDLEFLIDLAQLIPKVASLSPYPPIRRDMNLVVEDVVRWADVESIVRTLGGPMLEAILFQETYRDAERLGEGKKSLLFRIQLRSDSGTLTNEEADGIQKQIVDEIQKKLGGVLRA